MNHPTPACGTQMTETVQTIIKSPLDAPERYASNEASAWAAGYNACWREMMPTPEPTEAEKRIAMREALSVEVWRKQNELSMVNCEYKALGEKRLALISQVSATQLKLTALKQEIAENA